MAMKNNAVLRADLEELLLSGDFEFRLPEWVKLAPHRAVNHLIAWLCSPHESVKARAAKALGLLTARMADEEPESARTIMRRLIWSLNDESGGIGWGAPEAMGEIMAAHERLAEEYHRILVSYIDETGNPLENPLLERGVLRGLETLARARPHLLRCALPALEQCVESGDIVKQTLARRVLDALAASDAE